VLVRSSFILGIPWLSLWSKDELSCLTLIGTCRAAARERSTVDIARRITTVRAGLEAIFDTVFRDERMNSLYDNSLYIHP
jgi:hypothetical protein